MQKSMSSVLSSFDNADVKRLFHAVRYIESNGNASAIRFEKAYLDGIRDNDKAVRRFIQYMNAIYGISYISRDTVKSMLSFSVMSIQMMTYNLFFFDMIYEYISSNRIKISIPLTLSIENEYDIFRLYLVSKDLANIDLSSDSYLKRFSIFWNGSASYFEKLQSVLNKFK